MPEIPTFSHLSLLLGHLPSQNVWFPVSLEVPASLYLPKDPPLFIRDVVSFHLDSAPLSLLISNYLPVLTVSLLQRESYTPVS